MKRILFVNYSAQWTGPANSLTLLLEHLRRDFHVAVLTPGEGALTEALDRKGIERHTLPTLSKRDFGGIFRLVGSGDYDLVYGNNLSSSSRLCVLAGRLRSVPVVCHAREMGWDQSGLRMAYLRLASGVIAVSQACAESVRRFVRKGRLHVVYNGVELDAPGARGNGAGVRAELGTPDDALVLLGVSHINVRKGQEYAIQALDRVLKDRPDAHLWLVGSLEREPDYVDRLRAQVDRLGISGRVHLLGYRSDVADVLHAADVFVHTALADPHPRSVIEAMAASRPVVAFATDGVAESVVPEETGLLVDAPDGDALGQAVLRLAGDPPTRVRFGQAGRLRAEERFSARATADRVGDILTRIIEGA